MKFPYVLGLAIPSLRWRVAGLRNLSPPRENLKVTFPITLLIWNNVMMFHVKTRFKVNYIKADSF